LLSAVPEIVPSSLATFARGWNLFLRIWLCRWSLIEQRLLAFHPKNIPMESLATYQRLLNIHKRRSWRRVLGVCGHFSNNGEYNEVQLIQRGGEWK
jgi:hypothetical protein